MKGIQKLTLMMLLPTITMAVSERENEIERNREIDRKFQFIKHCFGPFPTGGSAQRLRKLRQDAENDGGNFEKAVLARVRAFLLNEVSDTLKTVALKKGYDIEKKDVLDYASRFLELKLETPFSQENNGIFVYEMSPDHLPVSVFTYFVGPYLLSTVKRFVQDEQINFD